MTVLVTVVVVTRNRAAGLRRCLAELARLPEQPRVIVVDNGSTDATAAVIEAARVDGIFLRENAGAAGRNAGVRAASTPLVAFSDDDSWWAPGALERAAGYFARHGRLALIAGRVLVGRQARLDPMSIAMAESPFASAADLPGPSILGFVACGTVVRRVAYLEAGGFHRRFGIGGEESLLAIDLAARGWGLAYCDDVVALHHPEPGAGRSGRRARLVRNHLWTVWLRCPVATGCEAALRASCMAVRDREARAGVLEALGGIPWVVRERLPVPDRMVPDVRRALALS